MKKYRGALQLLKDGLVGVAETGNKTSFMFLAETSFSIYKKYFKIALENNLLEPNGDKYILTEKGKRFIRVIKEAEKLIGEA